MDFKPVKLSRRPQMPFVRYSSCARNMLNITFSEDCTRKAGMNRGDRIMLYIDWNMGLVCVQATQKKTLDTRALTASNPKCSLSVLTLRFNRFHEFTKLFKEGRLIEAEVKHIEPGQIIFKP